MRVSLSYGSFTGHHARDPTEDQDGRDLHDAESLQTSYTGKVVNDPVNVRTGLRRWRVLQLLPGTSPNALGEYSSTLEEARADLFGLYYCADPKMVELGIMPDAEAYKAEYANYIRNGLMVQFSRVELGRPNTEAHMQNRKLISEWCYERGLADKVIEKKVRKGKTYFVVNDYKALRGLFGDLLAEIQRIKSEGDYEAGKALVEKYAQPQALRRFRQSRHHPRHGERQGNRLQGGVYRRLSRPDAQVWTGVFGSLRTTPTT